MSMAAYQYIYTMKNVSKIYPGGREIMKNITLAFLPGAKIGVLGVNGAGKSTLLKIMAGIDQDYRRRGLGRRRRQGRLPVAGAAARPGEGRARQRHGGRRRAPRRCSTASTRSRASFGEPRRRDMDELIAEQAELQEKIDACNGWDLERTLEIAMDALRCPPGDAEVTKLSGGERRRVALCRLLLSKPDMLLLDEPTNHLDAESVAWLERFLAEYTGTVVAVTHDRYFLDNVAGWILELDRGHGIPYEGNYSAWLEQKQKRLRAGGARGQVAAADPRARAGVDPPEPAGAPAPRARRASRPTSELLAESRATERRRAARSRSRPARAWATW